MIKERWVTDTVWVITLVLLSGVYHGTVFLLTLIASATAGRCLASLVFDSMRMHWISKFYFDALFIITIFPYFLKDVIMRLEKRFRFNEFLQDVSTVAKTGSSIIQALGVAYLLGTSYGLVITTFEQRLEASGDAKILSSPLYSILLTLRKFTLREWSVSEQITSIQSASEQMIYLQFVFLTACLFPIYCTVRCFRNHSEEDETDVNMRLHLWQFLWSGIRCCAKDAWEFRRSVMYLLAFAYEILQCGFLIILPLVLAVLVGKNGINVVIYGKCAVLYSVIASGSILILEDMILSEKMRALLKQNIQARHIASVLLLYLTSIPVFMMFFSTPYPDVRDSLWMSRKTQLLICVSSVAYCAYGCSKITISKAAFMCATLTTTYFAEDSQSLVLDWDGEMKKPHHASRDKTLGMTTSPASPCPTYYSLHNESDQEMFLP